MKQRSYLALEGITVEFPTRAGRFCALDGIDLEVEKGQFVALIGHSGCGKSTLLNAVAGLVKPTRGAIFLAGERSEEHTSELQSLMRISSAVFCLQKNNIRNTSTDILL